MCVMEIKYIHKNQFVGGKYNKKLGPAPKKQSSNH
jgi:hypothetical protein